MKKVAVKWILFVGAIMVVLFYTQSHKKEKAEYTVREALDTIQSRGQKMVRDPYDSNYRLSEDYILSNAHWREISIGRHFLGIEPNEYIVYAQKLGEGKWEVNCGDRMDPTLPYHKIVITEITMDSLLKAMSIEQ